MADWQHIRAEVEAIYRAVGYAIEPAPWSPETTFVARRPDKQVAVSLPMTVEPKREQAAVLADAAAWRPDGKTRIFVVGIPTNLSMGAKFQTDILSIGAVYRSYTGLLDGGYNGVKDVGLALPLALKKYDDLKDELTEDKAARENRVSQRYWIGPDWHEGQGDLLAHLIAMLDQPIDRPQIVFLSGVGGGGKSILFKALFSHLYSTFNTLKRQVLPAPRPIPVTPNEIRRRPDEAGAERPLPRNAEELFDAVAATSYGAATKNNGELLSHLVARGRNILMLDGLDEFYRGADFEPELTRRFLQGGSTARILVVLRDSLYAAMSAADPGITRTIEALRLKFGPQAVHQFELARWEIDREHRALAEKLLDGANVAPYFAWLGAKPAVEGLTDVPFYADLTLNLYQLQKQRVAGAGDEAPDDEQTLLKSSIKAIIAREFEKLNKGRNEPAERLFSTVGEVGIEDKPPTAAERDQMLRDMRQRSEQNPSPETHLDFVRARNMLLSIENAFAEFRGGLRLYYLLCCVAYLRRRMPIFQTPGETALWRRLLGRFGLVDWIDPANYNVAIPDASRGVSAELLEALYKSLHLGHDADDERRALEILRQFVLFRAGAQAGTVEFTHEIIADFMAAEHVINRVTAKDVGLRYLRALVGVPTDGEAPIFEARLRAVLGDNYDYGMSNRRSPGTTQQYAADLYDLDHKFDGSEG